MGDCFKVSHGNFTCAIRFYIGCTAYFLGEAINFLSIRHGESIADIISVPVRHYFGALTAFSANMSNDSRGLFAKNIQRNTHSPP